MKRGKGKILCFFFEPNYRNNGDLKSTSSRQSPTPTPAALFVSQKTAFIPSSMLPQTPQTTTASPYIMALLIEELVWRYYNYSGNLSSRSFLIPAKNGSSYGSGDVDGFYISWISTVWPRIDNILPPTNLDCIEHPYRAFLSGLKSITSYSSKYLSASLWAKRRKLWNGNAAMDVCKRTILCFDACGINENE